MSGVYHLDHVEKLRGGFAGTERSVQWIVAEIRKGRKHPAVREFAVNAIVNAGVRERDYRGEVRAITTAVMRRLRFTRDIFGIETIHSAASLAQKYEAGDCDDHTILLGAALESVGHETRVKIIGQQAGRYRHVYLDVLIRGEWVPVDPTLKHRPIGSEVRHRVARTYPVGDDIGFLPMAAAAGGIIQGILGDRSAKKEAKRAAKAQAQAVKAQQAADEKKQKQQMTLWIGGGVVVLASVALLAFGRRRKVR